jgi:hypothetical protein
MVPPLRLKIFFFVKAKMIHAIFLPARHGSQKKGIPEPVLLVLAVPASAGAGKQGIGHLERFAADVSCKQVGVDNAAAAIATQVNNQVLGIPFFQFLETAFKKLVQLRIAVNEFRSMVARLSRIEPQVAREGPAPLFCVRAATRVAGKRQGRVTP